MPLLEGLDGVNKMSKSLGNYVGIDEPPADMFGKLMSISDELMWRYYELLVFRSTGRDRRAGSSEVERRLQSARREGRRFAQEIVARFHDQAAARHALEEFESRFRHGGVPDDLEEQVIDAPAEGLAIAQVLKAAGVCASTSEALRMMEQGGVKVDGQKVTDKALKLAAGATYVLQVGKRKFARVTLRRGPEAPEKFSGGLVARSSEPAYNRCLADRIAKRRKHWGLGSVSLFNKLQPIEVGAGGAYPFCAARCIGVKCIQQCSLWIQVILCEFVVTMD